MASKAIGFLNFKFGADLSSFERAMNKAQKKLKKFGKNIQKTGKSLTMGLTLPIVALGASSVKAFDEQQKAIAQVEAGLKSTAGTVGLTSKELQKMAADLQKTTLFGDEEILKGATSQLLTFTNITGEQFKKTQKITLDLATRLDGDLKSSAIMLGKALNDPVANLSALSRAGIQFSEEQKATVKSLVETNDLAGAQTLILAELEKQYGGSAEAAALAGMGPITQLNNQLSDLSEQIGARLLPYIKTFVTWLTDIGEKFDSLSDSTKDNIVFWGLILAAIGPVLIIIGKMSVGVSTLIPLFKKLTTVIIANPYLALAAAIIGVAVALEAYMQATSGVIDKKEELNNIERTAAASIAPQLASIQRLVSVYDSENSTLDDKKKALEELKKLYPDYYGAIDETTFSTGTLKAATNDLTKSLMDKARLVAFSEGIEKITASIIDLEIKGSTTAKTSVEKFLGHANKAGDMWRSWSTKVDEGSLKENKQLLKLYTSEFEKLSAELGTSVIPTVKKVSHETKNLNKETKDLNKGTKDLTDSTKQYSDAIYDNIIDLGDQFQQYSLVEEQMEGMVTWTTRLTDSQKLLSGGAALFGDILSSSLESALESQENFFTIFIRNIKKAITSLLIELAIMTMIDVLLGGKNFSKALLTGNAMKVMNIPQFAEGGLVTGPTTALIGEGPGTTTANPEVVAPLDKLKGMIGGSSQHITVTGKLIGNDIFLSNAKTGVDRLRTV